MRAAKGLSFQGGTSTGEYTVRPLQRVQRRAGRAPRVAGIGHRGERPWFQRAQRRPPRRRAWRPDSTASLNSGFLTQFRGLGSYAVPKIDVEVSATYQSKPGALLAANYNMPAAQVAQFLGRAPSGGVANVTMNLVTPGTLYGDRINELDLRFAKILQASSRTRRRSAWTCTTRLNAARS